MKRLLCIVSGMNTGGAETFLMKMYRKLDHSKYQMDFCVNIKEEGFYDDEIRKLGGKIYKVPSKSDNFISFKKGLKQIVKDGRYKYVMRITSNAMGFLDLKYAKKAGAMRTIARSSNSSDGGSFVLKCIHYISRFFLQRYVDVKIAPSDYAACYTFGERVYKNGKVSLMSNALDLEKYRYSIESREKLRQLLNIDKDALVVGHIGRFANQKNHVFLVEIFAKILEKDHNAKLILVGEGDLFNDIKLKIEKLRIQDSVFMLGVRSDISDILSAIDVFVLPSLYEGMPNTVIEAQACGLPCFISETITRQANITGNIEYLPLMDSNKWVNAIINHKENDRIAVNSALSETDYNIDCAIQKFVKLVFDE